MTESRLDAALAARGLARSRTHAARLIADGLVTVGGTVVVKPSARVSEAQQVVVAATDEYVSRGAHKLATALDEFDIPVLGRLALDAGASTGGFSQVLLRRSARRVIALDVGHGQLAEPIAEDPRLVSVEGFSVRYLTRELLAETTGVDERPGLVVGDLSFISLTTVLPALVATARDGADFILLIKPQFEVGRSSIREGVVHSAALREKAVTVVLEAAWQCGVGTAGLVASPLTGGQGNHEYLAWLSAPAGRHPTEWMRQISTMVGA